MTPSTKRAVSARRAQRPAGPPANRELDIHADRVQPKVEIESDRADPARWSDRLSSRLIGVMGTRGYRLLPAPVRWVFDTLLGWATRRGSLQHQRSLPLSDPLNNIVLPADEVVHLPMVWVVEMFPPSYAAALARNIRKAGWREIWPSLSGDAEGRVRRARTTGTINSTTLARLLAADEPSARFFGFTSARLPKQYRSIEITMIELQNSLTAIVAAFELREDESLTLDRALRVVPEPRIRPIHGGGHSVRSRLMMSEEHVALEHARVRADARQWLIKRIPGVFAVEADGKLPVMDLITTTVAAPFIDSGRDAGNYLPALGLGPEFYATKALELPGLRFSEYRPSRRRQTNEFDLFNLAGRFSEILSDEEPHFNGGPRTMRAISTRITEVAARYLSRLAITSLLSLKGRQSATARDAAHSLHGRRSIRSLKTLRESFLRGSLDTLSIATAVKALASEPRDYKWNVVEFETQLDPTYLKHAEAPKAPENQLDYLALYQTEQAEKLIKDDSDTRQILSVIASLSAAVEGMRTQRWAFGISVLSLIVALVAVLVTVGWDPFWAQIAAVIGGVVGAFNGLTI